MKDLNLDGLVVIPPDLKERDERQIVQSNLLLGIRLISVGDTFETAAKKAGVSVEELKKFSRTSVALKEFESIQGELDLLFKSQFKNVVQVLNDSLVHPDPGVALAGAGLWLRYNKATKGELTPSKSLEDVLKDFLTGKKNEPV